MITSQAPLFSSTRPDMAFSLLAGNIGYLLFNAFEDQELPRRFLAEFSRIGQTDALVVDLRGARGEGSANAWKILSYLMGRSFPAVRWMGPACVLVRRCMPGHGAYARPMAVLIGRDTDGAAEDFAVTFNTARRGLIWGEPTGQDGAHSGVQPHRLLRASDADVRAGRDVVLLAACQALRLEPDYRPAETAAKLPWTLQEHSA